MRVNAHLNGAKDSSASYLAEISCLDPLLAHNLSIMLCLRLLRPAFLPGSLLYWLSDVAPLC